MQTHLMHLLKQTQAPAASTYQPHAATMTPTAMQTTIPTTRGEGQQRQPTWVLR